MSFRTLYRRRFTPPVFPIFRVPSLSLPPRLQPPGHYYCLLMRDRSVVRATGFPALGSSAVRRPGRSSETAGPPVALPAPARGFRAGVLSLLYSGDQSASSFLEAFCLFRHRRRCCCCHCRLPTPFFLSPAPLQLYALRFAPLALHPHRIFLFALRVLVAFVFHLPPCLFLSRHSRRFHRFRRRCRCCSFLVRRAFSRQDETPEDCFLASLWTNFTLLTRQLRSPRHSPLRRSG